MKPEPIYFNLYGNWYKGTLPPFMPLEGDIIAKILEDNYLVIKDEILSFYAKDSGLFDPMYVPHNYHNPDWKVFNFYGFTIKNRENIEKFPQLNSVLQQIPNMVGAQISVLKPHTRIKAHISGSNALIRYHLGILIPGKHPHLGIRVKTVEKAWEEGKVLAFTESHRHYAWNYTDLHRIVLLVDVIRPNYAKRKNYICAASLAIITMKMFATKFPSTKKIPIPITKAIFNTLTIPLYFLFFLQNSLGLDISKVMSFVKFNKTNNEKK